MGLSCNGCRVLRKGCSEDCILRPCLHWLNSPQSQSNATLFLAKFYGRAGLLNLLAAAPPLSRPEIFKSLLYEACGRIINPVLGSVGLMSSGEWPRCHAAVEAVLGGSQLISPLQSCDIRHVSKGSAARAGSRCRRRRSASLADSAATTEYVSEAEAKFSITGWDDSKELVIGEKFTRGPSHDSFSVETVEPSLMLFDKGTVPESGLSEVELELSLGMNPLLHTYLSTLIDISDSE
ncbi:LOB domain-containing protein 41-like [Salvia hispanica]|uniref:LOB domain-containing protein 41-like n=1 Tax=Salvia hispanica TaxID=49212 RepID=UPI002008F58B|nr:LOB domain-containing protein 41-like [Salvia hispanica]